LFNFISFNIINQIFKISGVKLGKSKDAIKELEILVGLSLLDNLKSNSAKL
jgi:hypothetical protein